ncbi:ERF family protein [Catalinimonas sp. 4WD22]|uniref:ERF family protein n=1 Tax=Catalinimonas locisalis TaxID=3133978 RepID=UPI0031014128
MTTTKASQTITLAEIQSKIHVPKSQWNDHSKFNYRSCEDVLNAIKKVVHPLGYWITCQDDIIQVGDRIYIKATVTLTNGEQTFINVAYAREQEVKKGMDSMQITGSASSYARKYALNGLFAIDDIKDADSQDNKAEEPQPEKGSTTVTTPAKKPEKKEYVPSDEPLMSFKRKFAGGTPGQIEMLFDMLILLTDKDMEEAEAEYNRRGRTRSAISDLITRYQAKVDKLKSEDPATISYKKDLIKKLANPLITEEERTAMISGINKMTFGRITKAIAELEQTIAERQYTQKQTA